MESNINNIIKQIESLLELTKNFEKSNFSQIDIDLALEKTRNIYDNILNIDKTNEILSDTKDNNDITEEIIEDSKNKSEEQKNIFNKIFTKNKTKDTAEKEENIDTHKDEEITEKPIEPELSFDDKTATEQEIKDDINNQENVLDDEYSNTEEEIEITNETEITVEETIDTTPKTEENTEIPKDEITEEETEILNFDKEPENEDTPEETIKQLNDFEDKEEKNNTTEEPKEEVIDEINELITETEKDINTKLTVNDLIALVNKNQGIGDKLAEAPIANIKSAISLNDKIWYINNIFNGDTEDYNNTVDTLNNFNNIEQALEFINNKFDFEEEKESLNSFLKLIYRRFINS